MVRFQMFFKALPKLHRAQDAAFLPNTKTYFELKAQQMTSNVYVKLQSILSGLDALR